MVTVSTASDWRMSGAETDSGFEISLSSVGLESLRALAGEWAALADEDACAEPFHQPEWHAAFAAAFEPQSPIMLLTARSGSSLRAVLPMVRKDRFFYWIPARTLRSLSGLHSCRFDLVHGNSDRAEVVKAIWKYLREDERWDVIEALDVPEDGAFRDLLVEAHNQNHPIAVWPTRKSPCLPLSATKSDPFRNCPKQFKGSRSRFRGKQRKLEASGPVEFHCERAATPEILRDFFTLEASGWKGREGSAIAISPVLIDFYTRIAVDAARKNTLRMYSLRQNGRAIAMHFGLEMDNCYYMPKVAYDEEFRKSSPGHLLMQHVITDLTERGVTTLDFLGPRMEWKCVWTSHVREHANCYIFRPTTRGRLLHALMTRAAPAIRGLKHRIYGDPQEVILKQEDKS